MPRFKQPLQGLSRLSDRVGAGVVMPEIISSLDGTTAGVPVPALLAGDLVIIFACNTNAIATIGPPAGYTTIASVSGTGTNTTTMLACYRIAPTDEPTGAPAPTGTVNRVYSVTLRGAKGIGGSVTYGGAVSTPAASNTLSAIAGAKLGSRIIGCFNSPNVTTLQTTFNQARNWALLVPPLSTSVNPTPPTSAVNVVQSPSGPRASISVEVLAE